MNWLLESWSIWVHQFTDNFWTLALGAGIAGFISWLISNKRMPASHRIAILGFPQAGKTTLIAAVFAYYFRRGIRGASIVPRGEETITRVNSNMEALELHRPIAPTRDQDVFAYRAEVKLNSLFAPRNYKLEIGDFPGEDTVAFVEQYGEWLHRSNYFEWAIAADAFVFVIDVGAVMKDRSDEYVARQKSAIRAAWQRLREHHLEGESDLEWKPLILAFTKADLALRTEAPNLGDDALNDIVVPASETERVRKLMVDRFDDLIDYLRRENQVFTVVLTSVVANVDGERWGVSTIAKQLLPRPMLRFLSVPSPRVRK